MVALLEMVAFSLKVEIAARFLRVDTIMAR